MPPRLLPKIELLHPRFSWRDLGNAFYAPPRLQGKRGRRIRRSQRPNSAYGYEYEFLEDAGRHITSFADVGCALKIGAPTTRGLRRVLPEKVRVLAVDVIGDPHNSLLKKRQIEPMIHDITKAPLPEPMDAIRFRGVSTYLGQSGRRRALVNIYKSLNDGGYLMGTGFILRKDASTRGFVLVQQWPTQPY